MKNRWPLMLASVVLVVPSLASAQTEWLDEPTNPVIESASPEAWDGGNRYPMAVIEVDGTYHMFFSGQAVGSPLGDLRDIGHATSTDGVTWEMDTANPVLVRGPEGAWDDASLWGAALIHDESGFRMWYEGFGTSGEGGAVGYATSPDGSTWTKHEDNPIMEAGPAGSFDDGGVMPRTVILDAGLYRMWYTSSAETGLPEVHDWRIGYAESSDGLSWVRHPRPVLEPGSGWEASWVYAPSVLFDGAIFHMWYTGARAGVEAAIGYATSSDGVDWARYLRNPVVEGTAPGFEWPIVLWDEGSDRYGMWYRDHDEDSIRRATSECCSTVITSIMPAAAYGAGAGGSYYETDVDVSNAGTTIAEYRFAWFPRGEIIDAWIESELFTLGPGMSVRYNNVLEEVFNLEPDAYGALAIEASSGDLLAMGRIANVLEGKQASSYGQAFPVVSITGFTGQGERRRLLFGTENAEMRTNIGCTNATGTAARVNLELLAADGTSLGIETLILMPWGNEQVNRIFVQHQPITGCVDYWADTPDSRVYCYGSVLNNATSDPITITPR